jgi:anti-anti-sigma regulatory factor
MLKISRTETAGGEVVLTIEGTLGGAWVAEVRAACDALIRERKRAVLDLGGVTFVDRDGAELLASLSADRRVAIEAASAFVAELMKGGAA